MKHIVSNWKTTLLGIASIAISIFVSKGKIDGQTGAGILTGVGLILAKDGSNNTPTGDLVTTNP
jgi:hypothetical protein